MTNEERALNAMHAVAAFWGDQGEEELLTKIGDLLANLRHLCDMEGISYDEADKMGRSHHACERLQEDGLAPDGDERKAIDNAAADAWFSYVRFLQDEHAQETADHYADIAREQAA